MRHVIKCSKKYSIQVDLPASSPDNCWKWIAKIQGGSFTSLNPVTKRKDGEIPSVSKDLCKGWGQDQKKSASPAPVAHRSKICIVASLVTVAIEVLNGDESNFWMKRGLWYEEEVWYIPGILRKPGWVDCQASVLTVALLEDRTWVRKGLYWAAIK